MKIFIVADIDSDWWPKIAFEALKKYSSIDFVNSPEEADLVWIFSYYIPCSKLLTLGSRIISRFTNSITRKKELRNKPFLVSFHHLDRNKEKEYKRLITQLDGLCDYIHFFSEINLEENRSYFSKPMLYLPYWIDRSNFHPISETEISQLKKNYSIPLNKCVIGSFQRDTEKDLKTPKIIKGPDVFCDIIEGIKKQNIFVLLTGPRRNYIENRLSKRKIPFLSLGKVEYSEINGLYNCLDYYLVTSRCEGGPQAILEAMATKTKIFSTSVGISNLLSDKVILKNSLEFIQSLNKPYPDVIKKHFNDTNTYDVKKVVSMYEKKFESILDLKK